MRNKRALLLLICALSTPIPSSAQASDDMFGLMFRMMLTMMNVMSGAMLGNNNSGWGNSWGNNLGGMNSFGLGMSALPMMSGFGSPFNSFGSSPWSSGFGNPYGGGYPGGFSPPFGGSGYPGGFSPPFGGSGYPGGFSPPFGRYGPAYGNRGAAPPASTALIEGRWYGSSGEMLEVRGNRFRLQAGGTGLDGVVGIENNIISMYSPQTNAMMRYNFVRNQTGLLLQGMNGELLPFTRYPSYGAAGLF
jgi:hypothetical protein